MTLKEIIERIESISLAHDQLKSFYFGLPSDFLTDKKTVLPGIFLQDVPGVIDQSRNELVASFKMYVLAIVKPTSEEKAADELQVQSDMLIVAQYLLAEMNDPAAYTDWSLNVASSYTLLREEFDDLVAGVVVDIQIRTPYTQDICDPMVLSTG